MVSLFNNLILLFSIALFVLYYFKRWKAFNLLVAFIVCFAFYWGMRLAFRGEVMGWLVSLLSIAVLKQKRAE
ncbi:hypothetical protein Rhal01_03806 [Rubritalea halochordaticola]|uniref:Uncharacterized protein n=1 Tax=Rubritalea halochordaticola TaxID=714537 RepID=A0ABP9V4R4_9BACT